MMCGNKPQYSSLMPSARDRKQGGEAEVLWCHPVWHWPAVSTIQPTVIARVSLSGHFYRVASCDRWPVASGRAIFHRHFHCPRSRSSILCGCLRCLRPPREAGWPRRLMTTGLAGRTHPSAKRWALSLSRFTSLFLLYECILFPGKCAVNFRGKNTMLVD